MNECRPRAAGDIGRERVRYADDVLKRSPQLQLPAAAENGGKREESMSAGKPAPFLGVRESELQATSAHAVTRSFARNTVVITEGDRSDSRYIIL